MKNKYKILLISVFCIIAILAIVAVIYFTTDESEKKETIKVLESLDGFPYVLKENDSKLEKDLFYELEKVLSEKETDNQVFAELIAQLFVVDVFSLDNKLNKYDIGGLEFILNTEQEKFKNLMSDSLYDVIQNNYDGKRKQELPAVNSVKVNECTEGKITFDNEELLAYDIILEWTYEKDLGYDTSASLKVMKKDNLMYVVSYNPEK